MRVFNRKSVTVVATGTLVLTGAGVAFAFWTASGEGSGSATTSAGASNLAIVQTSTISNLAPNLPAQAIAGTVTNKAENNAYVASVTVSVVGTDKAGCDASDYTVSNPTMTVAKDLASGGSFDFSGASIAFNNKAENQDDCKGATVELEYVAA